jgi:hypothetical protein
MQPSPIADDAKTGRSQLPCDHRKASSIPSTGKTYTDRFRCTHGSSLSASRSMRAPFPVTVAMFVDAARPHPGWTRRASVLTGLAEEIGSGVDEPALGPALEPCFSGQAPCPAA